MKRENLELLTIGLLLKSTDNIETSLDQKLTSEDFNNPYLAQYCNIVQNKCFKEGITPTTTFLFSELKFEDEKEEKEHRKYLSKIKSISEPAENFKNYLNKLKQRNLELEILNTMNKGKNQIKDGKNGGKVLSETLYDLMTLEGKENNQNEKFCLNDGLQEQLKRLQSDEDETIISTGYVGLDRYINGGFRLSTLNYIIGRPSNGKSTIALNIALNTSMEGNSICYVSLEMPMDQVMKRFFSSLSIKLPDVKPIPLNKLKNSKYLDEEDWESLNKIIEKTKDIPLYIEDRSVCTIAQYYALVNKYQRVHGVDSFIVDYYQLLRLPNGNQPEKEFEFAALSEGLRTLARKTKTAQIALAQVSRKPEDRPLDKRAPRTSDMRNSGKADQDAEVVLGAFREEYYTGEESERPNEIDIYIRKNRDGGVGQTTLYFNGKFVRIENLADESYDDHVSPEVKEDAVVSMSEKTSELRDKFKSKQQKETRKNEKKPTIKEEKLKDTIRGLKEKKAKQTNNNKNSKITKDKEVDLFDNLSL